MIDLVKVLGSLQADDGRIAVAGINDAVRPMTPEEEATYAGLDFDPAEFAAECGASALRHGDKKGALTARWRYPSLSIHGIEGAWSGAGAKTVIPRSVIGKFSIRLVPDMAPDAVAALVEAHLKRVFADLATPNTLAVRMLSGAKAWLSDFGDFNYSAARRAIETVFGEAPDLTREGGSIPVTLWLQEATGKSVMLLPIGACDDSAHSQNEKLNISNYMNGIKVLGAYLHEVAQ
jgi:nonspecific dipeptidase